jgi:hypothetical protein
MYWMTHCWVCSIMTHTDSATAMQTFQQSHCMNTGEV